MSFWLDEGKTVLSDCVFSLNYAVLSVKNNNSGSHLLKAYDMPETVLGALCASSHLMLLTNLFYRYNY